MNDDIINSKLKGVIGQPARTGTSCAACKLLKRRCTEACVFAPHFRGDELKKFAKVHKVFGASNVSKILVEVGEERREDAVNSLVYEAEARLLDPVYGCIGAIALLQRRMLELQHDLALARSRLAHYAPLPPEVSAGPMQLCADGDGAVVGFHDQVALYGGDGCEFGDDQVPPFPLSEN